MRSEGGELRARVLSLRAFPEFALASHGALAALAEAARPRLFRRNEPLLVAGRPARDVLVLLDGKACIQPSIADAERFSDSRGDPSDVAAPALLGLVEVIAGQPLDVTVTAISDTTALVIPRTAIRYQIEHDFSLVRSALGVLARRLIDRRGHLPLLDAPRALPRTRDPAHRDRPLTTVEKLLELRRTPWGARANLDAIAEMARDIREVRFRSGEYLFRRGDLADRWYRIERGVVRCELPDEEPVEVDAGHILGMIDAHAAPQRCYSARASEPVVALEIELADLHAVLEAHLPLAAQMTAMLARRAM